MNPEDLSTHTTSPSPPPPPTAPSQPTAGITLERGIGGGGASFVIKRPNRKGLAFKFGFNFDKSNTEELL